MTRVLAGPWCTQILGDLGADVIKVERPGTGDDTRQWGPPFATGIDGTRSDAAYYLCANRNKRSVAIDLQKPRGAELVRRLAADADVLVENYKVGGLAKYGLDYATLAALNPRLVYCSITGYGQDGPRAGSAGYDYVIQALGGLMSITGEPDGEPMKVGVAVADLFTGIYAANAILAALLHARATGRGQYVDMALFDVQLAMLANQAANYFATGNSPKRLGNAHPNLTPYQVFETMDGSLVLAVGNDRQFVDCCTVLGRQDLAEDPRFATNAERLAHRAELTWELTMTIRERGTAELIEALDAEGVPCGPINGVAEAFSDPQALARGCIVEQRRSGVSMPIKSVASPLRLQATPPEYRLPPPALGEHTADVLAGMGLCAAEISQLLEDGVIGTRDSGPGV